MELQRQMGFGGYQTAWTWPHKIRKAMIRLDPGLLTERAAADETCLAGPKPGRPWCFAAGRTVAVGTLESGLGKVKHWLLGRHRGGAPCKALQACLDELDVRSNRRTAKSIAHRFARPVTHSVQI